MINLFYLQKTFAINKGAFTYDVRFVDRKVGQAASDFTKKACVVKYLIGVGR